MSMDASTGTSAGPVAAMAGRASWADARAAPEAFARGLLRAVVIAAPAPAAMLCPAGGRSREPVLTAGAVDELVRAWSADGAAREAPGVAALPGEGRWMAAAPCRVAQDETLVAVALIQGDRAQAQQALMRVELVCGLAEAWRVGREQEARADAAEAPGRALGVLAAVNEHDRFFASCLAACHEIAERWEAERVSIALVRSGAARLEAVSHAERLAREGRLSRSLEAAMDEAIDQDREVACPPDPEDVVICRAAREHLSSHATGSCVTLPLRRQGECVGAICVEWVERSSPPARVIESLRLTAELLTPRILDVRARDRWIGARAWTAAMEAGAALVGPRHTGVKLLAILAAALLLSAIFVQGPNRVTADMTLESVSQRVLPAPFDGYLASASVEVGDVVAAGQTLATLDTAELRLEVAELRSEQRSRLAEEAIARREGDTAAAQAARAAADRAAARIELLEGRVAAAELRSPIAGVVVEGDLERRVGAPVTTGDRLLAIAPVDALRAELQIPEGRIAEVSVGSRGELATASFPERRIGFTVERIDPVARVVEGGNVFAARVRLDEAPAWMRPGMEGVAKVGAGRRSYAAIWTRDLVNWVRMKLWI